MQRLPTELIEDILILVLRADPRTVDPQPLVRVAPGLARLRRTVFMHSKHKRVWTILDHYDARVWAEIIQLRRRRPPVGDDEATFYLALLCAAGRVDLLNEWRDAGRVFPTSPLYVDQATGHGSVDVLKWLVEKSLAHEYTEAGITDAVTAGTRSSLRWWKTSGLAPKISRDALLAAVQRDSPSPLNWMCSAVSGDDARFGYDWRYELAPEAFACGSAKVLTKCAKWIPCTGYAVEVTDWTERVRSAVEQEQVGFLDWIYRNVDGALLDAHTKPADTSEEYGVNAIQSAADDGEYGYDWDFDEAGAADASAYARFWRFMVGYASKLNRVAVLDWFLATVPRDEFACPRGWSIVDRGDDEAAALARLEWWVKSGVQLKLGRNHARCAGEFARKIGFERIAQWWDDFNKHQLR
ncbi:hypothetical protein H9P43_009114 [Blastocladiella emersonii ATCC 22665]|nr:hypothetical protein H9P43_009114 [Blastocladiella emersonii ATCC 22665]